MAPKRVKLAEFIERKRDQGVLEIETDDGTVFSIDPPEVWTDEQQLAARMGNAALAQALLGERYGEFLEKGGSGNRLIYLISEEHGVSLGE